jgi:hypothetical protein
MPGELPEPSEPRLTYSTYLLLHNVLRILAADKCEIVITAGNVGPALQAAWDLPAFGIVGPTVSPSGLLSRVTLSDHVRGPGPRVDRAPPGSGDAHLLPF